MGSKKISSVSTGAIEAKRNHSKRLEMQPLHVPNFSLPGANVKFFHMPGSGAPYFARVFVNGELKLTRAYYTVEQLLAALTKEWKQ